MIDKLASEGKETSLSWMKHHRGCRTLPLLLGIMLVLIRMTRRAIEAEYAVGGEGGAIMAKKTKTAFTAA